MWDGMLSLSTLYSGGAGPVVPAGRGRASAVRAFAALVAVLLVFAGLAAPAQAQVGAAPPVENLRCVGETDRIAFLWEAAEWPGGETASYEYWLTMPDGSESSGSWGKWFSRTSAMMHPGSYSPGDRARLRLVANYRTPAGREVTGAQASLSCYVGGANELVITPTNTTRVYGEADALGYTVSGLVDGDTAASVVTGSVSRAPGDNAGRYDIGLGTLAIASVHAGKYVLPDSPVGTYVITPKPATYTSTGADKQYDATTAAPASLGGSFAAGDILPGDVVTVSGGTYSSADAGTGLAVSGSTVGGADAGNYRVTASVSGDITPRAVTATSGVRVRPRLPDGTTTASFDTSAARATGVVASQLADLRAGGLAVSGTFPSAEPGAYDVSVTYALRNHRGFTAANYTLTTAASTAKLRGVIQQRRVVTVSGVRVNSRLADGTTTATFDTSGLRATGVPAAELADFRAGGLAVSGAFPSADAGAYDVKVTYTLQSHGSFDANGYTLSSSTATLRGVIQSELQNSLPQRSAGCEPSTGDDYDADDDGLIEVCNLAQLSAIRYDLDGDGSASGSSIDGAAADYEAAFPGVAVNGPGCPQSGCTGYELTADLDFDTNANGKADSGDTYWNSGKGWLPIGLYTAVFDGNGHTIHNLYFTSQYHPTRPLQFPEIEDRIGLFHELTKTGVIRNVMLEDVNVSGNGIAVGALAGWNHGTVSNAGVSGTVSGSGWIGALVGYSYGTIEDSHSSGAVSGKNRVGGLVGQSYRGRVLRSWSTADVSAVGDGMSFGGLVGFNTGSIVASYATGQVSGNARRVGGLVGANIGARFAVEGENTGEIFASYATGDVSGRQEVGGLAGFNEGGPISASYALGAVSGGKRVGGLVGLHSQWRIHIHRCVGCILASTRPGEADRTGVTASYWNGQASGQAATQGLHLDSIWDATVIGTRRSDAGLRQATGYDGKYALWDDLRDLSGDSHAWDFGTSLDFPVLRGTGPSVAAQRALMPDPPESPEPLDTPASDPPAGKIDYDQDDDGLIEVRNLEQLDAIRFDMAGTGAYGGGVEHTTNSAKKAYRRAYPRAMDGMGCPKNRCIGYELMNDLDFDTNGNGRADPGDHYWNGIHLLDSSAYCIDWYKWHPVQAVRTTPLACDDYWGNDGEGWRPLARDMVKSWHGIFDGNGHTIRNLYSNTLDTPYMEESLYHANLYGHPPEAGDGRHNYSALFRGIGDNGVVRNLRLENVSVSGKMLVGAVAGKSDGIISNVHVTGSVSGISHVGGLVGEAQEDSYITGSSSRVNVAGRKTGGKNVGGLVGLNEGVIQASHARGAVSGWADNTGGLVGRNEGSVESPDWLGMTPGGSVAASYATGPVSSAGRYAGGLVGRNSGSIAASYATGGATADGGDAGGLVGSHDAGTVTAAYWDTQASGQAASAAGVGKTTTELQSPTGYVGMYAGWNVDLDRDGVGNDPWDFGTARQYPVLQSRGSSPQQQRAPFTAQALSLPRIGVAAPPPPDVAPNQAPTVSGSLGDVTLTSGGATRQVSLSGLFNDGDGDSLTVTASALTYTAVPPPGHDGDSYIDVVSVSVSSDYSVLTLTGRVAGTALVTVTANDGNGGVVSAAFVVTVNAPPQRRQQQQQQRNRAPTVANALADAVFVNERGTRSVSLVGTFSDTDSDSLTVTAVSSNTAVATVSVAAGYNSLTLAARGRGTATVTVTAHDADGNRVSDSFEVTVAAVESVLSGIAARYDADNDGAIDGAEYQQVKTDWIAGKITNAQFLQLVRIHLKSR